jgi:ectoine hydroxylase-related dioxygenase (phytanoyl-CoA dioxygenase family)
VSTWNLTLDEITTYHRDGLLAPRLRLPDGIHAQMRTAVDKLLRDNEQIAPESLVCPHIPYGDKHNEAAAAQWFSFTTQPRILDLVEQLIGPDIVLWGSQVFCKPPKIGRAVPWHQDGQYWPMRPLATCSVWMAIDDALPENGCMRYIAGAVCTSIAPTRAAIAC